MYIPGELNQSILANKLQRDTIRENIDKVEQFYPQLVQDLNLYTVRSAKLRDAGDQIARSLNDYAQSESPILQSGLRDVAECLSEVQDHRESLVAGLETKVVAPFSVYETRCEKVRMDAEQPTSAQRTERITHRHLVALGRANQSTQHPRYIKAEAKYRRASDEVVRSRQTLREQASRFERERVRDLKQVFGEFLLGEMNFFTKSLELYTHAYQRLMELDEEDAVEHLDDSMTESSRGGGSDARAENVGAGDVEDFGSSPDVLVTTVGDGKDEAALARSTPEFANPKRMVLG